MVLWSSPQGHPLLRCFVILLFTQFKSVKITNLRRGTWSPTETIESGAIANLGCYDNWKSTQSRGVTSPFSIVSYVPRQTTTRQQTPLVDRLAARPCVPHNMYNIIEEGSRGERKRLLQIVFVAVAGDDDHLHSSFAPRHRRCITLNARSWMKR